MMHFHSTSELGSSCFSIFNGKSVYTVTCSEAEMIPSLYMLQNVSTSDWLQQALQKNNTNEGQYTAVHHWIVHLQLLEFVFCLQVPDGLQEMKLLVYNFKFATYMLIMLAIYFFCGRVGWHNENGFWRRTSSCTVVAVVCFATCTCTRGCVNFTSESWQSYQNWN